jgi:GT2 family glycosyltransferase/O-antigen/teichoic acid export membrane protein
MRARFVKGMAAIFTSYVLAFGANIVLVPFFLRYWSQNVYSDWLVISAAVGYLSVLDFGLQSATINRLTRAYAQNDLALYRRTLDSVLALYTAVAVGGALLLLPLVNLLPLPAWFGLHGVDMRAAAWVAWLLSLQSLGGLVTGAIAYPYRATGNFATWQSINNLYRLQTLVFSLAGLMLGCGPVGLAFLQFVPFVLTGGYILWAVNRRLPGMGPRLEVNPAAWLSRERLRDLRSLAAPSVGFGIIMVATLLTQQVPVQIVARALGSATVVLFVTLRTLTLLTRQIVSAFGNVLWPELTRLKAVGDYALLRVLHRLIVVASTAICIGLCVFLWCEGDGIVTRWTGGKLHSDPTLLLWLMLMTVLQTPWSSSAAVMTAVDRHYRLSGLWLLSAVAGCCGAALLVERYGLTGLVIGLMLGEAVACYHFVIRDACRELHERYAPFAARLWLGLLLTGAASLGAGELAHRMMTSGPWLLRWLIVGAIAPGSALVVACLAWLDRETRHFCLARLGLARTSAAGAIAADEEPTMEYQPVADAPTDRPRVLVAVLNYNAVEETIETLRCLQAQTYADFDLELVDNASSNDCVQCIRSVLPEVRVHVHSDNTGYAGGNNRILKRGFAAGYDYVIVCNSDIEVDGDTVANLVETANRHPDAALVGGVEVCHQTGQVRTVGGDGFSLWSSRSHWIRDIDALPAQQARVRSVQGALVLFTRRSFASSVLMDDALFMYYEEDDLGFKVSAAELAAYVDKRVTIRHKNSQKHLNNSAGYYHQRNRIYMVRKYGRWYHQAVYLLYTVLCELPLKIVVRGLQGRWDYARACLAGFADGLHGRMGRRASAI